jgi:hypothetical protein
MTTLWMPVRPVRGPAAAPRPPIEPSDPDVVPPPAPPPPEVDPGTGDEPIDLPEAPVEIPPPDTIPGNAPVMFRSKRSGNFARPRNKPA